jgi:ferric-dicitrate binding protein FerR (iron transport regulator)
MLSPGTRNELNALIQRYIAGKASPQEIAFVEKYYDFFEQREPLSGSLDKATQAAIRQRMLANIAEEINREHIVPARRVSLFRRTFPAVAAALVFLLAGAAAFWYYQHTRIKNSSSISARISQHNDIPAGMEGAILTLASGEQIIVDTMQNGVLNKVGQPGITKKAGVLVLKANPVAAAAPVSGRYNTLTTPRSRQCQVVLPDGTKVWVNAASSIKFPEAFTGAKREIEMTGEAYFEVATDAAKPFFVKVKDSYIQVLGTHFNVMAYGNENKVQTTLLEGAVQFKYENEAVLLAPGGQCTLHDNGSVKTINDADVAFATAWKNGRQVFRNADVRTVMRQVERWYDLDVVYDGPVAGGTFSGNISRNANLSQVLKMLELSNIHFELDQQHKKLIVKP